MKIGFVFGAIAACLFSAGAASALTITFEGAVGGNPADSYQEGDFVFQPNAASNDVKCAEGECLNEFRQGTITTMVRADGAAFDLLGFYFALVGQGTDVNGDQSITVEGVFADATNIVRSIFLGDLLADFTDLKLTGYDDPSLTKVEFNEGYVVEILGGLFDNVVAVNWTTNFSDDGGESVKSAQARLDNVVVNDPAPVPVPAAGLMLIGALGALAAARSRKAG